MSQTQTTTKELANRFSYTLALVVIQTGAILSDATSKTIDYGRDRGRLELDCKDVEALRRIKEGRKILPQVDQGKNCKLLVVAAVTVS